MKIGKRTKNTPYIVKDENGKEKVVWVGRSVAVSTIVFANEDGNWYVLANQRGEDTPDYQGCWNNVCGYLEGSESGQEGCTREVYEETGVLIRPELFKLVNIETNPYMCSHSNVTLRYLAFLPCLIQIGNTDSNSRGGESGEVSNIKWIPIDEIKNYNWAFNHKETLTHYINDVSDGELMNLYQSWKFNQLEVTYD